MTSVLRSHPILEAARMVDAKYQVTGAGLTVAVRTGPAVTIPSPPATELEDRIWAAVTQALGK